MHGSVVFAMTGAARTPGGIAAVNAGILEALGDLVAAGHTSLTVLSLLEDDGARPPALPSGVVFRGFRGRRVAFVAALVRTLARRPLVLFDHVTLALPVLPFAAAGLVKTVIFAHGSEAWRRVRRTSRWSFRVAALCLTNSHVTLRRMRETLGAVHGEACLLGLPVQFGLNAAIPAPAARGRLVAVDGVERAIGPRMLLLVARIDRREAGKGYDAIVEALPGVREEYPDVQFVVAGPGDDAERVRTLARGLGVAERVFLPGFVPREQLGALYAACYAFVMPSHQEGFGLAYLEAMNFGKPCVGCRGQGAEDVIVHEETGLLLPECGDRSALSEALRRLLKDPALAERLGRAGFARLHATFTAAHFQRRILSAIGRVA
jgi:phosphatidylinositol alpha-1,6-mannosyltransferase